MLLIFKTMKGLRFGDLAEIYGYGLREEAEFYHYLRSVFFKTTGAMYCIWEEHGQYCSALRLEPFADGLVLAGLETEPAHRRRGWGTALVRSVLKQVDVPVYAHVHHANAPSIALHKKCGFRKIKDTATLLDGTTTAHYATYCYGAMDTLRACQSGFI